MSEVIFLTDLDNTIILSKSKVGDDNNVISYGVNKKNEPACYMGLAQRQFLRMMMNSGFVIPVTGRSSSDLHRVNQIEWPLYSVVSHGAIILNPEGSVNAKWMKEIEPEIMPREVFEEIVAKINLRPHDFSVRIVSDHGIDVYLCMKLKTDSKITKENIEFAKSILPKGDWFIHANGREMAILPSYSRKERAVKFLLENLLNTKDMLIVGAGDSLSDLPFMHLCDYAIHPSKSEIGASLKNV